MGIKIFLILKSTFVMPLLGWVKVIPEGYFLRGLIPRCFDHLKRSKKKLIWREEFDPFFFLATRLKKWTSAKYTFCSTNPFFNMLTFLDLKSTLHLQYICTKTLKIHNFFNCHKKVMLMLLNFFFRKCRFHAITALIIDMIALVVVWLN